MRAFHYSLFSQVVADPQGVKGGQFSNTHCSEYVDVQLHFNPHTPLGTLLMNIYVCGAELCKGFLRVIDAG